MNIIINLAWTSDFQYLTKIFLGFFINAGQGLCTEGRLVLSKMGLQWVIMLYLTKREYERENVIFIIVSHYHHHENHTKYVSSWWSKANYTLCISV